MFQFSDDFDLDLEDLLDVTERDKFNNSIKNNNVSLPEKEYRNTSPGNHTGTLNADLNVAFDALDEDDLILSAVEDIDNSFKENSLDKQYFETVSSNEKLHQNSVSLKKRSINISNRSNESSSSWSSDNLSHEKSNALNGKHKLIVTTDSLTTSKSCKVKYERKFPGPAGLVVRECQEDTSPISYEKQTINDKNEKSENNDTGHSLFENSPWQQLLNDINKKSCELSKIVDMYTVAYVKRMNIIKHKSRKIPLFAAVIHHLDATVFDPSVILKDPSGEIRGTLHKDLWERYNHLLSVGTALLLKQVSILSIMSSRKLYLNVTRNNLTTIYTPQTDGKPVLVTHLLPISISECVQEAKTDKNSEEEHFVVSHTETRNNDDLLRILNSSTTETVLNSQNVPSTSSYRSILLNENNNFPSKFPFKTSQNLFSPSIDDVSTSKVSETKFTTNIDNNNSISVLSEFEGIDEDSLFDDF